VPYGLYRASEPVQGFTLPLPYNRDIPLLPYGPYGMYRASVPVQGCTLPFLHPMLRINVILRRVRVTIVAMEKQ
jgi:hypothetical protein